MIIYYLPPCFSLAALLPHLFPALSRSHGLLHTPLLLFLESLGNGWVQAIEDIYRFRQPNQD